MNGQRGFTLIELLCALTILALVLAVTLRIVSGGSANAAAGRDYATALAVAGAHLTMLQTEPVLAEGRAQGRDGAVDWQERIGVADDSAFADAAALKLTAWRLEARARTADGREVVLTSVRLERKK